MAVLIVIGIIVFYIIPIIANLLYWRNQLKKEKRNRDLDFRHDYLSDVIETIFSTLLPIFNFCFMIENYSYTFKGDKLDEIMKKIFFIK